MPTMTGIDPERRVDLWYIDSPRVPSEGVQYPSAQESGKIQVDAMILVVHLLYLSVNLLSWVSTEDFFVNLKARRLSQSLL